MALPYLSDRIPDNGDVRRTASFFRTITEADVVNLSVLPGM